MTIRRTFIERVHEATEDLPATVEKRANSVRRRGHARQGKRGPETAESTHLDRYELAAMVLAEAADKPALGGEAVDDLAPLVSKGWRVVDLPPEIGPRLSPITGESFNAQGLTGERLLDWLARNIEALARPEMRQSAASTLHDYELVLSRSPRRATVSYITEDESGRKLHTQVFAPDEPEPKPASARPRHQVVIPLKLLLLMGEMYQDTLEKVSGVQQPPLSNPPVPAGAIEGGPDSVPNKAEVVPATSTPETENAPTVPAVEAPTTSRLSDVRAAGDSSQSQPTRGEKKIQSHSTETSSVGRSQHRNGNDPDGLRIRIKNDRLPLFGT